MKFTGVRYESPHTPFSALAEQLEKRTSALSVQEFAALLSRNPEWVYRRVRRGKLRAIQDGPGSGIRLDPKIAADFVRALQGIPCDIAA
jgi:hypothetical protein